MINEQDQRLFQRAGELYSEELKRHNDAGHPLMVLSFLVERGFTRKDGLLEDLYKQIHARRDRDGMYTVKIRINESLGGDGKVKLSWMSCDVPLLTYCMIKLNGNKIDSDHARAIEKIIELKEENGWRCKIAKELGTFRGPGRKDDECPFATLLVLKMLSATDGRAYLQEKKKAVDVLLNLWEKRRERRPYLFGIGTDFHKLKLPNIWFDILHFAEVLSRFKFARDDRRFKEVIKALKDKVTKNGYKPESIYLSWKEWNFGQKKNESESIHAAVDKIFNRLR